MPHKENTMTNRNLQGVRVIDFTRVLAGPYATRCLAAMGAEVIKVERPEIGDDSRYYPYVLTDKQSGYYLQLNSGKKSVSINLKDARGIQIIKELVKVSDVVVENFRPGLMAQMGLGYSKLQEENPRLIMCSISGFGQYGPYAERGGHGILAEALSGAMHITGIPGQPPPIFGIPVADISAGIHAMAAISSALFYREKSGEGQYIDIALLDCIFGMHEFAIQQYMLSQGKEQLGCYGFNFPTVVPYGVFKGKDGYLIIAAANDANWRRLTKAMDRPDMADDPRFDTNENRVKNQEEVFSVIQTWLEGFDSIHHAWQVLNSEAVPSAPVKDIRQAIEDPQIQAREMLVPVEHPISGTVLMPNVPFRFSGTTACVEGGAASIGQHTREVLRTLLRYDDHFIDELEKAGTIYQED